jgi:hypothetical protein
MNQDGGFLLSQVYDSVLSSELPAESQGSRDDNIIFQSHIHMSYMKQTKPKMTSNAKCVLFSAP